MIITCSTSVFIFVVSSGGASTGAGATIVGESTVPKKSGVIATQAGSSKIMHPEEDLSLVRL